MLNITISKLQLCYQVSVTLPNEVRYYSFNTLSEAIEYANGYKKYEPVNITIEK